jgi:hypothetical protein
MTRVLGSGTAVMPFTSKAAKLPFVTVHVVPPLIEDALVPRAPTLLSIHPLSMKSVPGGGFPGPGEATSQYVVPACNTGSRLDNAVSTQWSQEKVKNVAVRLQLSIIEPGSPPLFVISAKVNGLPGSLYVTTATSIANNGDVMFGVKAIASVKTVWPFGVPTSTAAQQLRE